MKKIIAAAALLLAILPALSNAQEKTEGKSSDIDSTFIEVKTVRCQMCVNAITNALQKVDGVESADVDLETQIAKVTYHPANVSLAMMEKAIASVGYDANKTKRNRKAYNRLCPCCK